MTQKLPFLAKNSYFGPEIEKSDLNQNSASYNLLEMTHSWFLAIVGVPSTIFVKALAIWSFQPIFFEIVNFAEKPPEKGWKIFFRQFYNFFSKSIHIWIVLTNLGP